MRAALSPRRGTRTSTRPPRRPQSQSVTAPASWGRTGTRISRGTAVVAVWATSSTLVAARRADPGAGSARGAGAAGARSPTPRLVVGPERGGAPAARAPGPGSAGSGRAP